MSCECVQEHVRAAQEYVQRDTWRRARQLPRVRRRLRLHQESAAQMLALPNGECTSRPMHMHCSVHLTSAEHSRSFVRPDCFALLCSQNVCDRCGSEDVLVSPGQTKPKSPPWLCRICHEKREVRTALVGSLAVIFPFLFFSFLSFSFFFSSLSKQTLTCSSQVVLVLSSYPLTGRLADPRIVDA